MPKAEKPSVIKAAASMSAGTILSRVLGYARDALLLAFFPRTVTDAFVVAFRLPNLSRRLLGEGSLSISFIPAYVRELEHSADKAKSLSNSVFTLLSLASLTLSTLAFLTMRPLLTFWVGSEGFETVAGKLDLCVSFGQVMVFYVFLVSAYAFFIGVAQAHGRFFWPALAPAVFNLVVIVVVLFSPSSGEWLPWGVLAGGFFQAGLVALVLYKIGQMPKWSLSFQNKSLGDVLAHFLPGALGVGVFQLMSLVNTYFAARLPEGSASFIFIADRILELPQSLIAVSLSSALLPEFSRQSAKLETQAMVQTARKGLRANLFLALPAAVGLFLCSDQIVDVLFRHGDFNVQEVKITAQVVGVFSVVLLASSVARITAQSFYAVQKTKLPAAIAAFVLIAHILLAPVLVESHGIFGLAWATSAASVLNAVLLQVAFGKTIALPDVKGFLLWLARALPAVLVMALWIFAWTSLVAQPMSLTLRVLYLGVLMASSMGLYLLAALFVGSEEAVKLKNFIVKAGAFRGKNKAR